jgi:hypothetical protein
MFDKNQSTFSHGMKYKFHFDSGEFRPETEKYSRPKNEVPCTNSLTAMLPYASYNDRRFDKEQLVFDSGDAVEETDHWVYDDRLAEYDYAAYKDGFKSAKDSGHQPSTAAFFQAVLSSYHQTPVKLKRVWTGCNLSNGYQYWAFAYSVTKEEATQE